MQPGRIDSQHIDISHPATLNYQPSRRTAATEEARSTSSDSPAADPREIRLAHSAAICEILDEIPPTLRAFAQPFLRTRNVPLGCAFVPRRGRVATVLVLRQPRDLRV
jgi:hypothetical protein